MYYSHRCSYCAKTFFVYDTNKSRAAKKLYEGIKKHLIDYGEDHKEYEFDEDPSIEANQMYNSMSESEDKPYGYEV